MKQLIKNYVFNAAAKTVTFSDFGTIALERVLLIVDVTASVTIYQFNLPSLGGSVAGNVLTLARDTTALANTDKLQIFYDSAAGDPVYDAPTVMGNAADAVADNGNPLKVGGVYTSSDPTYTSGQRANLRVDSLGRLLTTTAPLSNATDSVQVFGSSFGASAPTTGFLTALAGTSGNLSAWNAVSNNGTDAISGGGTGAVGSYMFNGTNWDRLRSASSTNGTTGTGVPASGIVGFDGTNYRRVATNSSGQLTLDPATTVSVSLSGTMNANIVQIGGTALALGQTSMAASIPVTFASNQSALTVNDANTAGLVLGQGSATAGQSGPLVQAAVSGSPPAYASTQTSPLSLTTNGGLRVAGSATGASTPTAAFPMGINGTSSNLAVWNSVNGNGTDGITGGGTGAVGGYVFNGGTWDRQRGNLNTVTGDTPTVTGSGANGAAQINYNARGAIITAVLGTVSGSSPTLTMQLQWSPDGGTTWLNYGPSTGAVAVTTGNTVAIIAYPTNLATAGAAPAAFTLGATGSLTLNAPLPRTWRATYAGGGGSPSIAISSVQVNYMV